VLVEALGEVALLVELALEVDEAAVTLLELGLELGGAAGLVLAGWQVRAPAVFLSRHFQHCKMQQIRALLRFGGTEIVAEGREPYRCPASRWGMLGHVRARLPPPRALRAVDRG
jgi:hypothetical protein